MTTPLQENLFDFEPLVEEEILVAIPPNSPFKEKVKLNTIEKNIRPLINLRDLKDEPFILLKQDQKLHKLATYLCDKAGFKPRIILESESLEAANALVTAGMGCTFIPDTLTLFNPSKERPLYFSINKFRPKRQFVIAYRKGRYLSLATKGFISVAKDILSSM
jgi:DNA-binding transcriptional LysR family regulator